MMTTSKSPVQVTALLAGAQRGDQQATNELFPVVYEELCALAGKFMHEESRAQTMQATALVHEAYMRLVKPGDVRWENRAHFFGAAAQAIRRILIDHARTKCAEKRGGGARRVALDEGLVLSSETPEVMVELDAALERLARLDAQKARVVELRYFAGLTVVQVAAALGVSPSTVNREWAFARAWLYRELGKRGDTVERE